MEYRVVFHPKAEAELEQLYDDIADRASPVIAWNFIVGIRDHCLGLSTFPRRGTERVEIMPGLRIIGYRRAVSIALAVEGERVLILGIFYAGRNITAIAGRPALKRCSAWRGCSISPSGAGDFRADRAHQPPREASLGRDSGTPLTISAKPTYEFQPRGYLDEKSKKHR